MVKINVIKMSRFIIINIIITTHFYIHVIQSLCINYHNNTIQTGAGVLTRSWCGAGPASLMLEQLYASVGPMYPACSVYDALDRH